MDEEECWAGGQFKVSELGIIEQVVSEQRYISSRRECQAKDKTSAKSCSIRISEAFRALKRVGVDGTKFEGCRG